MSAGRNLITSGAIVGRKRKGVARCYYVNTRDIEGIRLLTREKLLLQILDLKIVYRVEAFICVIMIIISISSILRDASICIYLGCSSLAIG